MYVKAQMQTHSVLFVCGFEMTVTFKHADWPPPYGVIRTPYDQWYQQAIKADYHVALLPLATQLADKFDEAAFWKFFNSVQGLPYGYVSR